MAHVAGPAGVLVGIAAAVTLTPLIFVVLLLLAGRTRAALTAAVTFVACGLLGYLLAPGDSRVYWRHHLVADTKRLGAATVTGTTGLLVSPVSLTHHLAGDPGGQLLPAGRARLPRL